MKSLIYEAYDMSRPALRAPVARRSAEPSTPVWTAGSGPMLLQRQPACPCGGGCPRCSGEPMFRIQAKFAVNTPGDMFEQEADQMADRVVRMPDAAPVAPVATSTLPRVQAKEEPGMHPRMDDDLHGRIDSLRGGGQPLDRSTRRYFESRFGHDFGDVRVHTDAGAAQTAQDVSAHAYTTGHDMVFATGRYAPGTDAGRRLIAHELTHVLQQRTGAAPHAIQRAETDTGAPGINCDTLADGSSALDAEVNSRLAAVRAALPAPIVPADMVFHAFGRLGRAVNEFLADIEQWSNANLPSRGGGYGLSVARGTKYRSVSGMSRLYYSYLAPVVKLNGICVGTDKIGHMFQQGFQYFMIANSARTSVGGTLGRGLGAGHARAWGEWMEGVLSPATLANPALMAWLRAVAARPASADGIAGRAQGHFGIATTGVHSRGDLESNAAGLRFYQQLLGNTGLTFRISNYVNANWNEEVSGNIYRNDIGTSVRGAGRLNPADMVQPP